MLYQHANPNNHKPTANHQPEPSFTIISLTLTALEVVRKILTTNCMTIHCHHDHNQPSWTISKRSQTMKSHEFTIINNQYSPSWTINWYHWTINSPRLTIIQPSWPIHNHPPASSLTAVKAQWRCVAYCGCPKPRNLQATTRVRRPGRRHNGLTG